LQVSRGQVHRLLGPKGEQRLLQLLEELARRPCFRARRRRDRPPAVPRRVGLVLGAAVDEERGHEEKLQPVRVLEGIVEPAERGARCPSRWPPPARWWRARDSPCGRWCRNGCATCGPARR